MVEFMLKMLKVGCCMIFWVWFVCVDIVIRKVIVDVS